MQEEQKTGSLFFNGGTLFFIFLIIYCDFILSGLLGEIYRELFYFMTSMSAFICSLIIQGKEIVNIYQQPKSLTLRREMFILGAIAFLLGFMKLWYALIFSNTVNGMVIATASTILAGNTDLVFMFIAGFYFVNAFHLREELKEKDRKKYLIFYLLILFIIVMVQYGNLWLFQSSLSESSYFVYFLYFLNVLEIFAFALILQTEKIINLISNKTEIVFRRDLMALGIASFILVAIKIWLAVFLHSSESTIIQSINNSDLWQVAYMFAAGMLLVRSFQIKADLNNSKECK